jgi:hypothetical protein
VVVLRFQGGAGRRRGKEVSLMKGEVGDEAREFPHCLLLVLVAGVLLPRHTAETKPSCVTRYNVRLMAHL